MISRSRSNTNTFFLEIANLFLSTLYLAEQGSHKTLRHCGVVPGRATMAVVGAMSDLITGGLKR
jgi:hypothetical protein